MKTTMTYENQGRIFYGYGWFGQSEKCNFFRWIDGENYRSYQVTLLIMVLRLQEAECTGSWDFVWIKENDWVE